MQFAMLPQVLLLLRQRHQGAPVVAVTSGHPGRLQDPAPMSGWAPELLLGRTEPLQAVAVETNREQR